ncbi:SHOCT domain-containing protein [Mycobacterium branderi]|uniref:SHOCT domain-containing protein n=1 Tax=Mycobacterium branderi TaxID=43348 RepID=A0A7I7W9V1_9MYCO|nr:SHOCT domain-containing protein [Mycobacterium branderi]MCV7234502.1 SHOCT domain-containing protein [Mycobacterium branderi]ORA34080.1 hypothetical protein BST20_20885 [Mycobacterium branderi]BBZ13351.1 hypothetical protein MBRA_35460 [Mycobacterium branderi]
MRGRRLAKFSLTVAILGMVVAVGGFVVVLVSTLFLDQYNAYGEVPIPGEGSLQLPAGDVNISLHTVVISSPSGGGLPVPPLGVRITPPDGVAQPVVTESIGGTRTVNNDAHVRVWVAHIAAEGTYDITTEGQVNGFVRPRLAFGHNRSYGHLVWWFGGMFVVGLIGSVMSGRWLTRTARKPVAAMPQGPPATPYPPSDEGVRVEQLKTLAALRDSGALTEAEFQAEKRRILDGR